VRSIIPSILKVSLFPLGAIFLIIGFQGGTNLFVSPTGTPAANPTPATASPTPDRLAEPTMPAVVTQADVGSQVFWLYCLPCHGDRGQGLTEEFRQLYPPDHQNCWASGCHGNRPYRNGWTLPPVVPRLIGDGALNNFPNAASLHAFISSAMPFQAPGTLSADLYWQVTAFLLRQNGLWDGKGEVNASNASQIVISNNAAKTSSSSTSAAPSSTPQSQNGYSDSLFLAGVGLVILVLFILVILQSKAKKNIQ
jgi:cytochrome c